MKCLAPISPEHVSGLKQQSETGPSYHVVSVELKDSRLFEQVVISQGCVIAVRGHTEIPFESDQIAEMKINHKYRNFRDSGARRARAASA
jgi:hypothetical protein